MTRSSSRPVVAEEHASATWTGDIPRVGALVATYGRPGFLEGLLSAIEQQDLDRDSFEVVVVDNGSTDETWSVLQTWLDSTPLRALGVRMSHNDGPAAGRNAGAARVRAPIMAITDDDCLPTPGWLRLLETAFTDRVDVVQGAVHADPSDRDDMGPWDHTKWIRRPTPFFETCNVAYRRSAFERVGGFDEDDPLLHPPSGRAFGEDACLGWAVHASGGATAWAPDAVVHHRCIPSDFSRWLDDQRELRGFPGLADRSPLIAHWLHRGVFLDRRSEQFDLAVAGLVLAVLTRRRWPVVSAAPWLRRRWRDARRGTTDAPDAVALLARYAWSDSVALAALVRGSIEHRRLVL